MTDEELKALAYSLPAPPTVQTVQTRYEKYPTKVLPLAEPIEVTQLTYSKDDGTFLWLLLDNNGEQHCFRTYKGPNSAIHYSNDPKGDKGRALADGCEELKELYGVCLRWIRENVGNAEDFLQDREAAPESDLEAAALTQSFRALERRIVVIVERGEYPD